MSTIKTTHLQHPSASSPNLTLAADGSVSGGAGLGGLVHIATESFTSVSSVSLDGCFSSEYENYLVMFSKLIASGGVPGNIRMRANGIDDTGANYTWHDFTANGGSLVSGRNTSQTSGRIISLRVDTNGSDVPLNVFRPFLATSTNWATQVSYDSFASAIVSTHVGMHYIPNSYSGFTFFPASGTVSGTIRVYGYKD